MDLSSDPKDNPILAAAIAGKADLIVSGDKRHMLALGHVEGIPIVTARDPLDRLPYRLRCSTSTPAAASRSISSSPKPSSARISRPCAP